jgi:4-hydroxy-2-oxoheptanedioate aldolase
MPKRINKAIELLEQGQPVYAIGAHDVSYEGGKAMAQTWADLIRVGMEHGPFDMTALHNFMRGLRDGGPTKSGHLTPTVTVELPVEGTSEEVVQANAWMFKQALATGVHGILFCHANVPEAVRVFVEACRYPFPKHRVGEGLDIGKRGSAGQGMAGAIWGLSGPAYVEKADVWPLNPEGELLLGLKIENRIALANVDQTTKVPGIAYAEWGPGDMGFAFGHIDAHDPPYPPEMVEARSKIIAALQKVGWIFFEAIHGGQVVASIDEGVRICGVGGSDGEEIARIGRAYTKRTMPV